MQGFCHPRLIRHVCRKDDVVLVLLPYTLPLFREKISPVKFLHFHPNPLERGRVERGVGGEVVEDGGGFGAAIGEGDEGF
jgi:hypothetical protein